MAQIKKLGPIGLAIIDAALSDKPLTRAKGQQSAMPTKASLMRVVGEPRHEHIANAIVHLRNEGYRQAIPLHAELTTLLATLCEAEDCTDSFSPLQDTECAKMLMRGNLVIKATDSEGEPRFTINRTLIDEASEAGRLSIELDVRRERVRKMQPSGWALVPRIR